MKYLISLNGKNYEVEVEQGEASIINTTNAPTAPQVAVNVNQASAQLAPAQTAPVQAAPASATQVVDGETVKAPMPGTILDIKVSTGTKVKAGDLLIILEAMKMENEITAPKDGVIAQILPTKGSSVSTGDSLIVLQ